ncbi:MAG: hypothetical protein JWO82_3382, partial [Akkermansiaceae bacterium]|nr:hypothetical protein [Akkermansiaceae bacterium]
MEHPISAPSAPLTGGAPPMTSADSQTLEIPSPHANRQPWKIPAVRRLQHHFYYNATTVTLFIRRRIRPSGIGIVLSLGILTFIAIGNPETPVYQVFCLAQTLVLAGLVWLPFRNAKMEADRELPAHATVGTTMTYRLHVRNLHRGPLHGIEMVETPPDARPSRSAFVTRTEPGEGERNAFDRFFAWYRWVWLTEIRLNFRPPKESPQINVKGLGKATVIMELTPIRRGIIRLGDLRVLVPEPLGLFQRCIRVRATADTLAVLPQRYRLPPFELPGSARFQPGGDSASRNSGPSGEFIGLREYQPGDPLRLIHWATWARTGRPVVRELDDTFFPRYGLILDTFSNPDNETYFEDAVSIAASFVSAADTSESLIDLMFIAGAERVVSAGHGVGRAETLLEVLAGVESTRDEDFSSLSRLVLRHGEDLAGCLCVLAGWSPSRSRFIAEMARAGIECAALVVAREKPAGLPAHVYHVRPATL